LVENDSKFWARITIKDWNNRTKREREYKLPIAFAQRAHEINKKLKIGVF